MEPEGTKLEHIAKFFTIDGTGYTRSVMVKYVVDNPGSAYVEGGKEDAPLVAVPRDDPWYVKTRADDTVYDNLLYLPGGPRHGK